MITGVDRQPAAVAQRSRAFALPVRVVELGGLLVAFYLAYRGVHMLEHRDDTRWAVALFIAATLLMTVVTWRVRYGSAPEAEPPPVPVPTRDALAEPLAFMRRLATSWQSLFFWGVLAVGVVLAIAWRFHLITNTPYGIWYDEAQNGIVARKILDGAHPIYVADKSELPALFFYVFAASMAIMGETVTALRTVTAIAGILTVVFVYLLGRELFEHRVGVIAAFLLAVMRWHLNFSRFGMHGIFAPLFMVTTLYFLVRGLKGKGIWNFGAAGVMCGIGLQGYYSFNLVPFIIGLYVVHHALFERTLPWKGLARGLGAFALAGVIIFAPLGIWALRHQDQFFQRSQTVSITKDRSFSEALDVAYTSTKKHLLMFNQKGDQNGRHNIPGAPMLDTYMGFLFILGAGYAVTHLKRSACFLLLAWAAISLLSGILTVDFEAPQAYRTVAITPAIALLAALPLALVWRIVTPSIAGTAELAQGSWRWPARAAAWGMAGAALLVTVFLLVRTGETNYDKYFNEQLKRADSWGVFSPDVTFVAKEMQRLGTGHDYRVSAVIQNSPGITFLNPDLPPASAQPLDWSVHIPSDTGESTVYLLDGAKQPFYDWLRQIYPGAEVRTLTPPLGGATTAFEVSVPADQVRGLQGIEGAYTPDGGGATVRKREPALNLDWSSSPPVALPALASWTGALRADAYKEYSIALDLPGNARLLLDDEVLAEGADHLAFTKTLYKGDHELRVEARIERPGSIILSSSGRPFKPSSFLSYPQSSHGLIGTFYRGEQWQGPPALVQLDPFLAFQYHSELDSVARPFTATWTGFLEAPESGPYAFEIDARESASLTIDGRSITTPRGNQDRIDLAQGRHAIEVRLLNRTGGAKVFLSWKPPSATEPELIPNDRFTPR